MESADTDLDALLPEAPSDVHGARVLVRLNPREADDATTAVDDDVLKKLIDMAESALARMPAFDAASPPLPLGDAEA